MAEMATITPLTEPVIDEDADWISFPEQGLHLHLPAIRHLHSIAIEHPSRPSVALEIATPGEPRSVSIAAIPSISDLSAFEENLDIHPSTSISPENYDEWRSSHRHLPEICACCAEAAENRRRNPENNPLHRILSMAVNVGAPLFCRLTADAFHFGFPMTPSHLFTSRGNLGITAADSMSMLEIDTGLCHSLVLRKKRIDAEPTTSLTLYNSFGIAELTIDTPGFDIHEPWRQLCSAP